MKELATFIEDYEYHHGVYVFVEFGGYPYVVITVYKGGRKIIRTLTSDKKEIFFEKLEEKLDKMLEELEVTR